MSLSIELRGHKLTQEQLDALVPLFSEQMMKGSFCGKKKFEELAVQRLESDGIPLIESQKIVR